MRLYLKLGRRSPFRGYFFYADTKENRADRLFKERGIRVKFHGDYVKNDEPYRIVVCSIPTKQIPEFMDLIKDFAKNMIIMGYSNYEEWCDTTFTNMKGVLES